MIRKISVPKRASHLTISPDVSKVAYEAKIGGKEFVIINDKKVLPEFDSVTFAQERFKKTGELIFAGYDQEKHEILHAISLVEGK